MAELFELLAKARLMRLTEGTDLGPPRTHKVIVEWRARAVFSGDGINESRQGDVQKLVTERGRDRLLGAVAADREIEALDTLRSSYPNFGSAIDHLLDAMRLARVTRRQALTSVRLLLVGPPGIGKTAFAYALAEILNLPLTVCDMAAAQAGAHLGGSEDFWSNTQPGVVWRELVQGTHANPLFVLDELDKASDHQEFRGGGYNAAAALFSLLEPVSARRFQDRSLPAMVLDASLVNWIATANDMSRVDPALLSRFTVLAIAPPTPAQRSAWVQHLYEVLQKELGVTGFAPAQLSQQMIDQLSEMEARAIQQSLRAALAAFFSREERVRTCH
jgi:ATP-dependent Lon protease